jgi:hypothetical protein
MPRSWSHALVATVVAGVVAIAGVAVFTAVTWGDDGSVNESEWVAANERGLDEIPVFRNLRLERSYSIPHGIGEGGNRPYDAYTAFRFYRLSQTRKDEALAYYDRQLTAQGWTKTESATGGGCEIGFAGKGGRIRLGACRGQLTLSYRYG